MAIEPIVRDVFGHFQNLNLLILIADMRKGDTARHAWSTNSSLCPVAHGLSARHQVQRLSVLDQSGTLRDGCDYAARQLGSHPDAVLRFVRFWDGNVFGHDWLLRQLHELWQERLADALVMQELLQPFHELPSARCGETYTNPTRQRGTPR